MLKTKDEKRLEPSKENDGVKGLVLRGGGNIAFVGKKAKYRVS